MGTLLGDAVTPCCHLPYPSFQQAVSSGALSPVNSKGSWKNQTAQPFPAALVAFPTEGQVHVIGIESVAKT